MHAYLPLLVRRALLCAMVLTPAAALAAAGEAGPSSLGGADAVPSEAPRSAPPLAAPPKAAVRSAEVAAGPSEPEHAAAHTFRTAGRFSLAFGLPNGDNGWVPGSVGLWYMPCRSLNLGFDVGLAINPTTGPVLGTQTAWHLSLAPGMKYYLMPGRMVMPYAYARLFLNLHDEPLGNTEPQFSVQGGFGAELALTSMLTLAGHFGLDVELARQAPQSRVALRTLTSAIMANVYF